MSKDDNPNETELQNLYVDLNKSCTVSDYEKVLKIATKIIEKYPEEFKAFHCKIIALMQLDRFEDALELLKNTTFIKSLIFEKCYCEYRLNRLDEAILTISNTDESDMRIQELLGQILYKQELYEECQDKYKFLVRNIHDAYEDERIVNMTASVTALSQWLGKNKEFPKVAESMFEISFNKACYLAANGQYEDAISKLDEAQTTCLHMFEGDQDVTAAEIDEELSAIKVQRAFCLQRLGRVSDANTVYHEVLKRRSADGHILAVAANNVLCANRDQNVFDSRKKLRLATADSMRAKLVSCQRERIDANHCVFQYWSGGHGESVRMLADRALVQASISPRARVEIALVKVAQFVRERQFSNAISFVEEYTDTLDRETVSDDDFVKLQLTVAQLHLLQGSVSRCNDILGELSTMHRFRFGVLGTRVTLYMLTEDVQAAIDCLQGAVDWYRAEAAAMKKGSAKDAMLERYDSLLRVTASFCVRNKRPEQGALCYEQLLQRHPGCQVTLASLIAAYSRFDKDKAEKTSRLLKDDTVLPEVDVDSLESAFIFGAKHMKKLLKGSEVTPSKPPGTDSKSASKPTDEVSRKKKRKPRLPKNFDPKKPIDPERWMPKRERAHYKGRKRDKRANMYRGPQGATGGANELDASKKTSAPNTPAAEPVKKPQPVASKPKPKSKPKKKLKW